MGEEPEKTGGKGDAYPVGTSKGQGFGIHGQVSRTRRKAQGKEVWSAKCGVGSLNWNFSFLNFDGLVKSQISHRALREHRDNILKLLYLSLRALVRQAKPG